MSIEGKTKKYKLRISRVKDNAIQNRLMKMQTRQLSCVPVNRAQTNRTRISQGLGNEDITDEKEKGEKLAKYLIDISPFNARWKVTETINAGAFGVVFAVEDIKTGTKGAIKVAKADCLNQTAEWESFVLEKLFKNAPNSSVVRLLDRGMLVDYNNQGMEFAVLEKAEISIKDYVTEVKENERRLRICHIALQSLKGISDMHFQGFLHRDFKPDNMGIISREQPIVLIFDVGLARMYTETEMGGGQIRPPRTVVNFRGTIEYASGHAIKCRDQTRFDDLISWFYSIIELFDERFGDSNFEERPFPWTGLTSTKAVHHLKSAYAPARALLYYCPKAFYQINTYLQSAYRLKPPNYEFIADCIMDAIKECSSA